MIRPACLAVAAAAVVSLLLASTTTTAAAFAGLPPTTTATTAAAASARHLLLPKTTTGPCPPQQSFTQLGMVFNNKNNKKKGADFDLSDIETRDMTPDEMRALNAKNEEIMNAELIGMTVFSLILSVPMLYLVWVGFFSETAGTIDDAMPY